MTLSRWLRDYLYIPLGGSRRGVAITYRNLLSDHAARRALARRGVDVRRWGLIHGTALCAERFWREQHGTKPEESFTWVDYFWRRLVTFHVVCFAWIFFRSETFVVGRDDHRLFTRWGQPSPLVTGPVLPGDRRRDRPAVPAAACPTRDPRRLLTPQLRRPGRRARGRLMVTQASGRRTWHPYLLSSDGRRERQGR